MIHGCTKKLWKNYSEKKVGKSVEKLDEKLDEKKDGLWTPLPPNRARLFSSAKNSAFLKSTGLYKAPT